MLSLGKQYYNLNVVNLLKWVMFCRMFKKAVLKKITGKLYEDNVHEVSLGTKHQESVSGHFLYTIFNIVY